MKHKSSHCKSPEFPRPKKAHQVCSKVKLMLFFLNIGGMVHYEYMPEGQTVNQHCCVEVLKWLRLAVFCERPKKWEFWAVHYDNASMCTAYSVHVSCQIGIPVVQQLSCSYNMAPYSFWLFSQLKMALNGNRFYDYFHFSMQKYVYINGQLIALFIIFFNISHIVFHI